MAQATEVILDLGTEGGGSTIFGRQIAPDQWRFYVKSNSMDLDDQDNDTWQQHQSVEVGTLETAINLLGENWILLYPLKVHPAFARQIWEAVQQRIPPPDDYRFEIWSRRRSRWEHLIQGE
jgi:hypothetical protein